MISYELFKNANAKAITFDSLFIQAYERTRVARRNWYTESTNIGVAWSICLVTCNHVVRYNMNKSNEVLMNTCVDIDCGL